MLSEETLMQRGFTRKAAKQVIKTMKSRMAQGKTPGSATKFVKATGKVKAMKKSASGPKCYA